jgi:ribonuclease T1
LLPDKSSGYYHEYTVPTPGASDRGARRIIVGSGGELYWTDDHYRSFERISP